MLECRGQLFYEWQKKLVYIQPTVKVIFYALDLCWYSVNLDFIEFSPKKWLISIFICKFYTYYFSFSLLFLFHICTRHLGSILVIIHRNRWVKQKLESTWSVTMVTASKCNCITKCKKWINRMLLLTQIP